MHAAKVLVTVPRSEAIADADQRIYLHDVSWEDFERFVAMRGAVSVPRITYLRGELELMSPSRSHELYKSLIGRLVEAWADEKQLSLWPFGSWLLKLQKEEKGIEPDECYVLGKRDDGEVPDLAIEVIWTSGGINKLEIYAGFGVREVWFWKAGVIDVYLLGAHGYRRAKKSRLLPDLDLVLLARLSDHDDLLEAKRLIRATVAAKAPPPKPRAPRASAPKRRGR